MKVKTITCHDVYNLGASLQAYALATYLTKLGHEVEIINYKPAYLRHYELTGVRNPRFDKPVIRGLYQIAKFPSRVRAQFDPRKKAFDHFTEEYLPVTRETYTSNADLKRNPPRADIYIAGSDQIWNPVFQNGKDPSFFLDFVPVGKKRVSYAASFAIEQLKLEDFEQIQKWLKAFDMISVRESSGVEVIRKMGLQAVQVCDPVFLLEPEQWQDVELLTDMPKPYVLVYDFDGNERVWGFAKEKAQEMGAVIASVFPIKGMDCDVALGHIGPREFLYLVRNACYVVSNSFHATAFSLLFHTPFAVFDRNEQINTRMKDLLERCGMTQVNDEVNDRIDECIDAYRRISVNYLKKVFQEA